MKRSQQFIPTLREVPAEAEAISHQLMLRAGLIRKLASGIYAFLPSGLRTFRKISSIVRQEMDKIGAQELCMSALLPAESYQASGRWSVFGPEMFRLQDRNKRDFCLGPTHEEIFTDLVSNETRSYRSLPMTLYQIQTKYRDERRPRYGLMRAREFVMKDAYSFDRDILGLDASYNNMSAAYRKIFKRCGLDCLVVDADTGAMGGSGSQEFMVVSHIGEAELRHCKSCGYAANVEKAACRPKTASHIENGATDQQALEKIYTPNIRTIAELTTFLSCMPSQLIKTLLLKADDKPIAALIRGDRELNEAKLQAVLGVTSLEMADPELVMQITGAAVGFAGPVGLPVNCIADAEVMQMLDAFVGANATDYHLAHVYPGRDFTPSLVADIRVLEDGEPCPTCGQPISASLGIEVGHVFKLGTKYSKAMNCIYLDESGTEQPMQMGCYGIGIGRTMAAVIEQFHDQDGIIWPLSIAPWQVSIIPVSATDPIHIESAQRLHDQLEAAHIEVLLDDRNERAGMKFKDTDLLGIPMRITIGRRIGEGLVEFKHRDTSEVLTCTIDEAVSMVLAACAGV